MYTFSENICIIWHNLRFVVVFFRVTSPGLIGKSPGSHGLILLGAGVFGAMPGIKWLAGWYSRFDVDFYDSAAVFEVFGSCQVWPPRALSPLYGTTLLAEIMGSFWVQKSIHPGWIGAFSI